MITDGKKAGLKTRLMAMVALALAGMLFATWAGSASSVEAHGDACGNDLLDVADSGRSFDFHEACHAHDACYADNAGGTESERRACDDAFLAGMKQSCREMWPRFSLRYLSCRVTAGVYYGGVRLGGVLFF